MQRCASAASTLLMNVVTPPPPPFIVGVVCSVEANGRAFGAVDSFFDAVVALLRTHRDNTDVMRAACESIINVCHEGEASRVFVCGCNLHAGCALLSLSDVMCCVVHCRLFVCRNIVVCVVSI